MLCSISSGLEFWLTILQYMKLKVFKNLIFFGEIFSNWPNDLLGTNVYKTLESCWQSLLTILKCRNTTSVISSFQALNVRDNILPLL